MIFFVSYSSISEKTMLLEMNINHSDATIDASSEQILKAAHLIAIFKSKWHLNLKIHVLLAALAATLAVGNT